MRPPAPPLLTAPSNAQVGPVRGAGASPEGGAGGVVSGPGAPLLEPQRRCPNLRCSPEPFPRLPLAGGGAVLGSGGRRGAAKDQHTPAPLPRISPGSLHLSSACTGRGSLPSPTPVSWVVLEDTELGRCREPAAWPHPGGLSPSAPEAGPPGDYVWSSARLAPTSSAPVAFPAERKSRGACCPGPGKLGGSALLPEVCGCTYPPTGRAATHPAAPSQTGARADLTG